MSAPAAPPPTVPSVLLPELLGFIPQFLLDDIINIANDEAKQSVDAMEQFLQRWADARAEKAAEWDPTQEIEQGLVSFQTLLESHVDVAFDFFEAWSMRNIFAVPADLPIVAPHQAGLDLEHSPEQEQELLAEIDELRRKVHAQRKLKRLYSRAVRRSGKDLEHARERLERLSFLRAPQMQALLALPSEFEMMFDSVASLPPPNPSDAALDPGAVPEPGKRPWETSKTGYLNWAVEQLMQRAKERAKSEPAGNAFGEGSSAVSAATAAAYEVGSAQDVRALLERMGGSVEGGKDADQMDTS
ncbi:Mis12-domain-containing protein [Trametes versicolor FP-101664 SS1]|uniref:Mis12-domain-containing protein n=1 Tax=Trametes versicolor (strain FP-101664) TaxID=717944 RepID=R7S7I0_TRAVS|nr:Mis12-domain-containing protein [Trametes versicolor FP-101664 SS1]EIW51575.1 Mis12-domain-containing protein [Trametes versicolor FP-101664 SS1]